MVIPDIKCTNGVVHIIDSFITIKVLISSDDRDCFGYLNQQSQHFFATVFLRIELYKSKLKTTLNSCRTNRLI
jgi:hypothetical protein